MKHSQSKMVSLKGKNVTGEEVIKKVIAAEARLQTLETENKALKKDRDQILSEFTDMRTTRPVPRAPSPGRPPKADTVRVSAGDVHGMMMDKAAVAAFLADVKRLNPDEIVLGGDIIECGGFLAKHHAIGFVALCDYTYAEDIGAANWFLDELQKAAPHAAVHYLSGNHECLHPDHEVLTKDGWKPIASITVADSVACLEDNHETVWDNPSKVHVYDYDDDLVVANTRGFSAAMTKNHRVPYLMQYGDIQRIRYQPAGVIPAGAGMNIPVSGVRIRDDVPLSDDEVMLAAWLLTDGCISSTVSIYQSKPDTVQEIRGLLTRLGIRFAERIRARTVDKVCGRTLNKPSLPAHAFVIRAADSSRAAGLLGVNNWTNKTRGVVKMVPAWVSQLSTARFDLFISTVIRGDGSYASTRGAGMAACVYGRREVLDGLQAACVHHGYRTSIKARSRRGVFSFWVLNLVKRGKLRVDGSEFTRMPYRGPVYCLTMPAGNFFTRLNGCVHLTGNSRVERWAVDETLSNKREAQFLLDAFGPESLLRLKERNISYYKRDVIYVEGLPRGWIRLGKMMFTHELGTSKNAAREAVGKTAGNVTFNHTHREDTATIVFPGVGICKAFNSGCLSQIQPIWKHSDPTSWSQGYAIDIIARSGNFQRIHVPIWRGESLAGAMIERFKS